jgi:hypothetical protein
MVVKVRPKVIIIVTTADDYIYRDVMDYGVYRDVMWLLPNPLTARLASQHVCIKQKKQM